MKIDFLSLHGFRFPKGLWRNRIPSSWGALRNDCYLKIRQRSTKLRGCLPPSGPSKSEAPKYFFVHVSVLTSVIKVAVKKKNNKNFAH